MMKKEELIPLYTAKDNLEAAVICDALTQNRIAYCPAGRKQHGSSESLWRFFQNRNSDLYCRGRNGKGKRTFRRYGILRKKERTEKKTIKNMKMKIARMEKNLSQIQLAERVGVTRQTIGMIEAGDFNPSLKLCISICKELDCTLNDLFWEE